MTKKRRPSDPRYPINRRSFLMSLCATGLAARPSGLAAESLAFRRSAEVVENLFKRYFFAATWIATTEAQALFAEVALLTDVASDPEAFCRGLGQRFESIGLSHVVLSVQNRSAVQPGRHFDAMVVGHGAVGLEWYCMGQWPISAYAHSWASTPARAIPPPSKTSIGTARQG